jgi:DNA-binding CsgD family transcriptional regulator
MAIQSAKKAPSRRVVAQKIRPLVAENGLVLMDSLLRIVAVDERATTILTPTPGDPKANAPLAARIPNEIIELIRSRQPGDPTPGKLTVRLGKADYNCHIYLLDPYEDPNAESLIALHLEKDSFASDAIREIADKHHLTVREQEVLRGISMGLATKEMAEWMSISPNTVKAFLRLVMIKMGVTTRAGIVAKILHNGTTINTAAVSSEHTMSRKRSLAARV